MNDEEPEFEEFDDSEPEIDAVDKEQNERDEKAIKHALAQLKQAGFDVVQIFVSRVEHSDSNESIYAYGDGPFSHRFGLIKMWLGAKELDF